MRRKIAIDLFCGTGGFSHGWIQGGGIVAVAVDSWQTALDNHKHNHPNVSILNLDLGGDIEETAFILNCYLKSSGYDDSHFHLHGSPPCQALSNASNVEAEDGMRLVNWFLELVEYMRPDSWSMENVRPLGKRLEDMGVPFEVVNSNDYGVPQKRFRIFAGSGWSLNSSNYQSGLSVVDVIPSLKGFEFEAAPSMVNRWKNLTIEAPCPTITSQSQNQIRIVSRRISKKMAAIRGVDSQFYYLHQPAHTITQVTHIIESEDKKRSMTVEEASIIQGWHNLKFIEGTKMKDKRVMVGNMVCPPISKALCEGVIE